MQASPGIAVPWEVRQALSLYAEIEQYGWEQVMALRYLEVTQEEGERLLLLLGWLQTHLPAMRAAFWAEGGLRCQNYD